ncbi:MAG: recombinase family protein, partial [bacterium]|nr:recombinase family protein [bacterium]
GILAWHPDRLARNSMDGGRIIHMLDLKQLLSLKFPTVRFESTPQDKFMLSILFGQSKYYVDNLSQNVERGMRQKIRNGVWPGWAPPGYLNCPVSRKILVDPVKGPLVKKLFEVCSTGEHPADRLRKMVFDWGLSSRKGTLLAKGPFNFILRNTFYFGLMKYKGELFQGNHPPLISKDLFDQTQKVLASFGKPRKVDKTPFPLLGFMRCAACGSMITAERQKGHHYYRCTRKKGKCTEPYVREESLANQMATAISSVSLPQEVYEFCVNALEKEAKDSSLPLLEEKTAGDRKIKELQSKLDRLLDAHLDGLIDKQEYQTKKEALLSSQVTLKERMAKTETGA